MAIRISIIEDDDWIRENLATQIGGTSGFQCVGKFSSAEESLDQIGHNVPDVILLDIGLPEMDGYSVARHLRSLPSMASTRIVALTGYGAEEARRMGREAGFDLHLVKPVDADELEIALGAARSR